MSYAAITETRNVLARVVNWWPVLQGRVRREKSWHGISVYTAAGQVDRPLVFDPLAGAVADEVRGVFTAWVKLTVDEYGAPIPRLDVRGLGYHLIDYTPLLAGHVAWVDYRGEIADVAYRVRGVVDVVRGDRRYLGECVRCGQPLYARVSDYQCPVCGVYYDYASRFAQRLNTARNHLFTVSGLVAFEKYLRECDPNRPALKRKTVESWIRRGRLTSASVSDGGVRLYRWGDINRLQNRDTPGR